MPSAENAKLEYEAGQSAYAMAALADSGDATIFTSLAALFSGRSGYAPNVLPNGLLTGGVATTPVSGSDDVIDVAALSCNLNGVVTPVSGSADLSVVRQVTDFSTVHSITINAAGAFAVVQGTIGTDATFDEVRGAAGGPPEIPVDSIEIAQVRLATSTVGVISSNEIFQVVGSHLEKADFPVYSINHTDAQVEFNSALPLIHTGATPKAVHASYSDPIFADVSLASDFVPVETSHSVTSTPIYGGTLGSSSASLGQGAFTAYLMNGVTDALVSLKNETLWFRFYPDKFKSENLIQQGKLGISRTFPAGDSLQADCTISASSESAERTS